MAARNTRGGKTSTDAGLVAKRATKWQTRSLQTRRSRDDHFISVFLSAYESGTWADAESTKPDAIDRTNPAVDQLSTRRSDGKTLAIQHTTIEPFLGEKEDFAFFEAAFLRIEDDKSLPVPGRWIRVFVPVGALHHQRKQPAREAIVKAVHSWLKTKRLSLPYGAYPRSCPISGIPDKAPFHITLEVKVVPLQRGSAGSLHVRRQQVAGNLGEVIEIALEKKLPKLVSTKADKRILLLERQHMNLHPQSMLSEIEKRRKTFPDLAHVDEIWIMETIFYGSAFGGTYLRFELYENGTEVRSFDFDGGKLVMKSEDGAGKIIQLEP